MGLFTKGDIASANSVHVGGQIQVRAAHRRRLTTTDGVKPINKGKKQDRAQVKQVMDRWKSGKLHSGSKNGPVVEDQDQAVAIALNSIRKSLFAKFNSNHGSDGRFTSGEDANQGGGGTKRGANITRATGEAIGGVGGTYGGQALGGLAGAALFGPAGATVGAKVGGFVGGFAGDFVGRRIAQAVYGAAHPGFQQPETTLAEDVGGGLGSTAGYMAAGKVAESALPEITVATATARALGQAAGDIQGTRFGHYVQQRVGGVMAETAGHLAARYGLDAATDAAADATTQPAFGKRGRIDGLSPPAVTSTRPGAFPPRVLREQSDDRSLLFNHLDASGPLLQEGPAGQGIRPGADRNDVNYRRYVNEAAPNTRFRSLLAERESKARSGAAQLAMHARRPENFQPTPGESKIAFRQRLNQVLAEQQAKIPPWKLQGQPSLFGEHK